MKGIRPTTHDSAQAGFMSVAVIVAVLLGLLLVGAAAFGFWAFRERQDYKNDVDQKITVAVDEAKQDLSIQKDKDFAEKEKSPLKTYTSPSAYGSVVIEFPKTWSGYVADDSGNSPYVDGYFNPGVVPSIASQKTIFALRLQVTQESYSNTLNQFQDEVQQGKVKISPYAAPKVPSVVGVRMVGQVDQEKDGVMIVLPLRDKTLKLWTTGSQYIHDFDTFILPNFRFSP
jgi:hypothetical protein